MPIAQNSQAQYCLSLRIVLVSSECRQTPCLQECRALVCLGFYSVWVAAESTPRVRFSAVHPVCGITQRGAPSADHSQSFLSCKSSLSWVVEPCSHSTALWLLPRRPCLLSRGNTTPWESWHLFCHTVTWPRTAAVPGIAWHPSGYVFISKPFLNRKNSAQDSRLLIIYALNGS